MLEKKVMHKSKQNYQYKKKILFKLRIAIQQPTVPKAAERLLEATRLMTREIGKKNFANNGNCTVFFIYFIKPYYTSRNT